MKLLIRAARIVDSRSPHNGQIRDILIENGLVRQLGESLPADDARVIEQDGLCVSPGWIDMRVSAKDPGYEHKEDLKTVCKAAAAGGFTDIAVLPNTKPSLDSKDTIGYVRQATLGQPVTVHPIAAVTKGTEGTDFTEMIDLHHAGAVAFSDGEHPLSNPDLFVKTLQYLQPFGGVLMNRPEQTELTAFGQMNEGLTSTLLGLKGLPVLAEELMVERDLRLLEYAYPPSGRRSSFPEEPPAEAAPPTETVLHFSTISSARAVELIRRAKQQGFPVSCDIAAHQLAFDESDLLSFETNLKVNPPFRTPADREALQQGLIDGTIDVIVSDHNPHDEESKNVEFDLAEFGITGLETAFAVVRTYFPELALEQLVDKLTHQPRRILRLPALTVDESQPATLTLFHPDLEWVFGKTASKSRNSPFLGTTLRGKPLWIVNKGLLEHL